MSQNKNIANEKVTIVRKAKKSKYSIISNSIMQDTNLSWKAKGILCYLLHLPDDWKINLVHLEKQATDGIESLRSGFKELQDSGYIQHDTIRDKGRILSHVWIVHEEPSFVSEKPSHNKYEPETGKPYSGFSRSGKSATTNTKESESKDSYSIQKTKDILAPTGALSADADDLLSFFIQNLKERKDDIRIPDPKKWLDEIDRMIRIDKRDPKKIRALIEWIHKDSFWSTVVLSPKKLRDQYDQIELQASGKVIKDLVLKNKTWAMRQAQKYPESYKELILTDKYAKRVNSGKEIRLDMAYDQFKRLFVSMFDINYEDLLLSDK